MRAFHEMPMQVLAGIGWLLADLDDTVTTAGRLEARAYTALERLQSAGVGTMIITGRPAGWCDLIARLWPVDAIVGENGAFSMRYDRAQRRMQTRFWQREEERVQACSRLWSIAQRIRQEVPSAALASDQRYRLCDLAVDIAEDVPELPAETIQRILRIFSECGATAKLSSIHVNGWIGSWDKLAMTRRLFQEVYGIEAAALRETCLFVGDSPNDAPMFGWFPRSVGVANVRRFTAALDHAPAYIAEQASGAGFVEVAEAILAAHAPASRPGSRRKPIG